MCIRRNNWRKTGLRGSFGGGTGESVRGNEEVMSVLAGNNNRIRVAVVGAGEFGRNHARVYRELPGADLVGVFDKNSERAAQIAAEFQAKAFATLEGVRSQVDAASGAVPTVDHAAVG